MGIFNKENISAVDEMTPLELVTHLFTCLQLADGRMDFEEREVWAESLSDLFPDHKPEQAIIVLQSAVKKILELDEYERLNYSVRICHKLKNYYSQDEISTKIIPKLIELSEADGVVLSSESKMIQTLRNALGIQEDN